MYYFFMYGDTLCSKKCFNISIIQKLLTIEFFDLYEIFSITYIIIFYIGRFDEMFKIFRLNFKIIHIQ